jgi:cell division septal protein FtsQ
VLPRTLKIRVTEREPIAQVNLPRTDGANGISVSVFQLDAGGLVMQPVDPRLCTVPLAQAKSDLPLISGMNTFQLQPGRRVELPQVQAALMLVTAFSRSPMAGLVDLRRLDVSAPGVIVVTTGQGGAVTFGLENIDQQLRRWREIYDYGKQAYKGDIASADLAVGNNVPVRWMLASSAPSNVMPKAVKPTKTRRKNV